jgi:hypothetical protein
VAAARDRAERADELLSTQRSAEFFHFFFLLLCLKQKKDETRRRGKKEKTRKKKKKKKKYIKTRQEEDDKRKLAFHHLVCVRKTAELRQAARLRLALGPTPAISGVTVPSAGRLRATWRSRGVRIRWSPRRAEPVKSEKTRQR